jgi:hypothetical protein
MDTIPTGCRFDLDQPPCPGDLGEGRTVTLGDWLLPLIIVAICSVATLLVFKFVGQSRPRDERIPIAMPLKIEPV